MTRSIQRITILAALLFFCAAIKPQVSDAGTPSATPPASPAAGSAAAGNLDAAARHAKRTACLKDARAKKLVGLDKTAFIKQCLAAP